MSPAEFDQEYGRYLAGNMTEDERSEFERRIASDPALSEEVYADTSLRTVTERGAVVRGPARWWRWAAPLAAAAIVLLGINLMQPPNEEPVMRGDTGQVELLAPAGALESAPSRFEWVAVDGATRYRFELMDARAQVIHRTVVSTTFVVLESGVPSSGAWRVVALDDLGQAVAASAPTRFDVTD